MFITNFSCSNFRNYEYTNINFKKNENINIIVAPNGMGKSNLLEAFYYLSYVRPFRQVNDKDLIMKKKDFFSLHCNYEKNNIKGSIEINYKNDKKEIIIDKKKALKHSEILGQLLSVLFSNDDIFIISGAQSIRRRFFNMFFSVIDPLYLLYLRKYDHLIKQKNTILRNKNFDLLYIFDEQIAETINYLQNKRNELILIINDMFMKSFEEIGFFNEKVKLKYSPSIKLNEISKENIYEKLVNQKKIDIEKGFSTIGSQKDDYLFYINNIDFIKYGSFGQLRLASLIIKNVQAQFYKKYFNTEPVFLLDDVILELDKERQSKFINYIGNNNQLFITVTDKKYSDIFNNEKALNIIEVVNGKIL